MTRIDAHQHFWQYEAARFDWIGPGMESIAHSFLPQDLAPHLAEAGMDGSVVVQAEQTLEETAWLLHLADRYPTIRGVVGWVDLSSSTVGEQLARFADHPKFRGVRHSVQSEPDDGFMLRPDFMRGIETLAAHDLTYDIVIVPRHLPAAVELASRFPTQPFVLDHLAKPPIKAGQLSPWERDIRRLAACDNVMCKVSGMLTEADWHGWRAEDFKPYLDVVFEAFGPERLMFGSDWPVCTLAGSYRDVLNVVESYVAQCTPAEQAAVFGGNAERFYRL